MQVKLDDFKLSNNLGLEINLPKTRPQSSQPKNNFRMTNNFKRPASGNKVLPFNMPPLPVHHINKKEEDF